MDVVPLFPLLVKIREINRYVRQAILVVDVEEVVSHTTRAPTDSFVVR